MTRRVVLVVFVVCHLVAITLGALPPQDQLSNFPERTTPSPLGVWGDSVTSGFDTLARALIQIPKALWWVSTPIQPLARWYRRVTSLGQSWAMFSDPPHVDRYMRTRYYIHPRQGRQWMATELVMPAHREDRVRLLQSYRDSHQDKAMEIALMGFERRRKDSAIAPGTRPEELPDDLAPIGRYFARRFERGALAGSGDRIVRIEVWRGIAETHNFGEAVDTKKLSHRHEALEVYYEGPVERRLNVPPFPPYHGGEVEADIQWILEYYEEK